MSSTPARVPGALDNAHRLRATDPGHAAGCAARLRGLRGPLRSQPDESSAPRTRSVSPPRSASRSPRESPPRRAGASRRPRPGGAVPGDPGTSVQRSATRRRGGLAGRAMQRACRRRRPPHNRELLPVRWHSTRGRSRRAEPTRVPPTTPEPRAARMPRPLPPASREGTARRKAARDASTTLPRRPGARTGRTAEPGATVPPAAVPFALPPRTRRSSLRGSPARVSASALVGRSTATARAPAATGPFRANAPTVAASHGPATDPRRRALPLGQPGRPLVTQPYRIRRERAPRGFVIHGSRWSVRAACLQ